MRKSGNRFWGFGITITLMLGVVFYLGACAMIPTISSADNVGDIAFGREEQSISFDERIGSIAWSPDQTRLAITYWGVGRGERGGILQVYDLVKGRTIWQTQPPRHPSDVVGFDPTGKFVIAVYFPASADTNTPQGSIERGHDTYTLLPTESGEPVTYFRDEKIGDSKYQTINGRVDGSWEINALVEQLAISSDGNTLASYVNTGCVALYDTKSWSLIKYLGPVTNQKADGLYSAVTSFFIDTKRDLLVAKDPVSVTTWDTNSNKRILTFNPTAVYITYNPVAGTLIGLRGFRPNFNDPFFEQIKKTNGGKLPFIMPSDDGDWIVSAWNPITGKQVMTYPGPNLEPEGVTVSSDGRYIAASLGGWFQESHLLLWEAATGKIIGHVNYGKWHWVRGLAFSPDSKKLAYAVDKRVHIVEINPAKDDGDGRE